MRIEMEDKEKAKLTMAVEVWERQSKKRILD